MERNNFSLRKMLLLKYLRIMSQLEYQRELFLSKVNNRETIAAIEANKGMLFLQKRIEKFPLCLDLLKIL